jgi:hypothetical protein
MKKLIVLSLILCGFYTAYSQADLIKEIKNLTLANDSLEKQVIKPMQANILKINTTNTAEVSKLQNQINTIEKDKVDLNKKIKDLEKDIADLNKNSVKIERDSLQKQIVRLNANVAELNKKNLERERQIGEEKRIGEQKTKEEKVKGKNEILSDIVNSYKTKKFDDLIMSSNKLSVQRDMKLVSDSSEIKQILLDLEKYYSAEELLAKKIDVVRIKDAQIRLNQIKQQSTRVDTLKENLEYYKDFHAELKKTIENLIELDKKEAIGDAVQKLKFNDIVSELSNYMFNYYEFGNYPYLSDIIFEIIKSKRPPNTNADISDLLRKLE